MTPIIEDKTKTQQTSATGAQAVADAVKRVADAAVAAVHQVPAEQDYDFKIAGAPGSTFRIDGAGFSTGGSVLFGGIAAKTTGWGATKIEGIIPAGAKTGEVVVWVDEHTQFRGHLKVA
jgi:hypothetical protein